jgi:hypothetical protein
MHKVTLVCSAHQECGRCNAEELLKILRAIEPETIFEELRPGELPLYYKQGFVEARAVTDYRDYKSFQHVPVDQYDMPKDLLGEKRELDQVFLWVKQTSQEYRELMERESDSLYEYGFKYLNSPMCATMNARMAEIEDETVNRTGDQRLIRALKKWRHLTQGRERDMVGNIYEYCRENVFDNGVFLVGAAHRTGIVKEIEKYAGAAADLINWNLTFDGQIP